MKEHELFNRLIFISFKYSSLTDILLHFRYLRAIIASKERNFFLE